MRWFDPLIWAFFAGAGLWSFWVIGRTVLDIARFIDDHLDRRP